MSLTVALVGCGKIADGHVEEIRKVPNASITAVCDVEPVMAEQLAVRYGIPKWFSSFDTMLSAARPDVVHITTPPAFHTSLGVQAMDAGCHVFMEKPLAMTALESARLINHAIATQRKLTINYWYNFESPALALRRLLKEGAIGDPVHIESHFGYNLAGEFGQALLNDPHHWVNRLPGKLFHNVLDHILNKIAPFIADPDPQIDAFGYRRRPATGTTSDSVFDELRVVLRDSAGVSAYATFTAHAKPMSHVLRVHGTKNTAEVDFNLRTLMLAGEQKFPSAMGRLFPPFSQSWHWFREGLRNAGEFRRYEFGYFAGMRELISRFYRSILDDTPPPIDYDEILRVSRWMDTVFAQTPQTPHSEAASRR
jgi:predicted dehydrogenase